MHQPHKREAAMPNKPLGTACARAAIRGYVLTVIEADSGDLEYVLTRGAICQRFADLHEVESWLASDEAVEVAPC